MFHLPLSAHSLAKGPGRKLKKDRRGFARIKDKGPAQLGGLEDEKFLVFVIQYSHPVSTSAGVKVQERGSLRLGSVRAHLIDGGAIYHSGTRSIGANDFNLEFHSPPASNLESSKSMLTRANGFQKGPTFNFEWPEGLERGRSSASMRNGPATKPHSTIRRSKSQTTSLWA